MLNPLIRALAERGLDRFERSFAYDAGYLRDILAASPRAFRAFAAVRRLSRHREDTPAVAFHAAELAATLAEDCGPCTQLVIDMAERDGASETTLRRLLESDGDSEVAEPARLQDVALAFRFGCAVVARAPELDALRDEVVRRWGRRALVSLAFAVASGRLYPTVKYALGHGRACTRVRVGGVEITPRAPSAAAAVV